MKTPSKAARRTTEKIQRAFAELISEKGSLNKITVSALVERAGITRGTFYNHYQNISEVAEQFQQEILTTFFSHFAPIREAGELDLYFQQVFDYLAQQEPLYRKMLAADTSLVYLNQLNQQFSQHLARALSQSQLFQHWASNATPERRQLDITFFVDGAMYLVLRHFRESDFYSLAEIRDYIVWRFWQTFGAGGEK